MSKEKRTIPEIITISPGQAHLWHADRLRTAILNAGSPAQAYKDAIKHLGLHVVETSAGSLLVSTR